VAARSMALDPSKVPPSASPAAVRKNSRRLQASRCANSRGVDAKWARPFPVSDGKQDVIATPTHGRVKSTTRPWRSQE